MKKLIIAICIALFSAVVLASCGQQGYGALTLDDVMYVEKFPLEESVTYAEDMDLGVIGKLDVALQDSVLLVSTQGLQKQVCLFKYPSMESRGEFISKGNGPGEVLDPIFWGYSRFYEYKDSLMLDIPNWSGDVVTWNVSKAFDDRTQETADKSFAIPGNAHYRFILNDSTVFARTQSPDGMKLNREIYSSGRKIEVPALDILNKAYVSKNDGYSFNILSGVPVYNDDLHILADASLSTNVINFLSLDGSFTRSVVIGKKALKISEAERMLNLRHQLINYFLYGVSYDDCCAFLYFDSGKHFISLFSWSGEPIERIVLPEPATSFCMDRENGVVIAVDSDRDAVYRYYLRAKNK